mmetsp:Transcript_32154/g.73987  ORF Transcript_32154/g.73987 Transcript_32154/m.73987 type:complete len:145 (-) Transcript_32154:471-905(-)
MQVRDELLKSLIEEAGQKCAVVARGQNYPHLLQKLIVQGLIKIEEMDVTIYCRKEDLKVAEKVIPDAVNEYVSIMTKASDVVLKPRVILNTDRENDLNDDSYGGVVLTACNGKIVCDNTMQSRLNLVYEEIQPSIRMMIFPEIN